MSHLAIWFRVTGSPVFGAPPDHDVPEHFYTQASSAENGVGRFRTKRRKLEAVRRGGGGSPTLGPAVGAYRRTWLKENPGVVLQKLPAGNSVEQDRPNPEASHCPGVKPLQRGAGFTGWHVCAVAETIHMRISF